MTGRDRLYAWGSNRCGQLGRGAITHADTPFAVEALQGTPIVSVASGVCRSAAVAGTKKSIVIQSTFFGVQIKSDYDSGGEGMSRNMIPFHLSLSPVLCSESGRLYVWGCGGHGSNACIRIPQLVRVASNAGGET